MCFRHVIICGILAERCILLNIKCLLKRRSFENTCSICIETSPGHHTTHRYYGYHCIFTISQFCSLRSVKLQVPMKYSVINFSHIVAIVIAHSPEGSRVEDAKKAVGFIVGYLESVGL